METVIINDDFAYPVDTEDDVIIVPDSPPSDLSKLKPPTDFAKMIESCIVRNLLDDKTPPELSSTIQRNDSCETLLKKLLTQCPKCNVADGGSYQRLFRYTCSRGTVHLTCARCGSATKCSLDDFRSNYFRCEKCDVAATSLAALKAHRNTAHTLD